MEIFSKTAQGGVDELLFSGFPTGALSAEDLHVVLELSNDWLAGRLSKIDTLDAQDPLSDVLYLHEKSTSSPQLTILQDFLYKAVMVLDMCSRYILRRKFLIFDLPVSVLSR